MASQVEGIKWVPGTRFLVDGFRFPSDSCRAYFLTHGHSDHTTGLSSKWDRGLIYCSPVTARLLRHDFKLRPDLIRVLQLDETVTIAGVEVTPIDAGHCPGAVMFLFRVPTGSSSIGHNGKPQGSAGLAGSAHGGSSTGQGAGSSASCGAAGSTASGSSAAAPLPATSPAAAFPAGNGSGFTTILHTGDFRWQPWMGAHPALAGRQVDCLMLDTTYCSPRWDFPPQEEAVAAMAELMAREAAANPATLFAVGSYHIGKERAYLGAAHRLGWRVHVAPAKRKLLRLLELPAEWMALLTDVSEEAQVHVLGMGEQLHPQALAERIAGTKWERAVALRPTGWSYRPKGGVDKRVEGCVTVLGIPYSEHSSWSELRDCVKTLRPKRLLPTVGASDPAASRALVDRLAGLMDLSEDRSRLDFFFSKREPAETAGGCGKQEGGSKEGAGQLAEAAGGSSCQQEGGGREEAGSQEDGSSQDAGGCRRERGAADEGSGSSSKAGGSRAPGPAQTPQHDPPQQQQQQHASPPAQQQQLPPNAEEGEQAVDLSSIDVREQIMILASIQSAQRRNSGSSTQPSNGGGSSTGGAGRGARGRGASGSSAGRTPRGAGGAGRGGGGGGRSGGAKRPAAGAAGGGGGSQPSIKRFFSAQQQQQDSSPA